MTEQTTNRAAFLRDYSILHRAGVGVTAIRTKEPYRALEVLRDWARAEMPRVPFKAYHQILGWQTYNSTDPNAKPTCDNEKNLVNALQKIDGVGSSDPGFPDGCYTVLWPHWAFPKIPAAIQLLAELAVSASESVKRISLIVPQNFTMPPELQESIAMIDFDLPNRVELAEAYETVRSSLADTGSAPTYNAADVDRILNAVVGMTLMEAESAIARAGAKFKDRFPRLPLDEFVAEVMKIKTEVIKRSECLEVMPVEKMEDVGGLSALKTWIAGRRGAFSQRARDEGVDMPKGTLLVGPPGTGKSLAAKAIAHALGLPLIRFDLSKVYGSLVGESEGKVRDALKVVEAMAPTVVLLDEIDKAVSKSEGGRTSDVSARILGTLLTFMQETEKPIFWVMSANRVQSLPPELVRKGRLDEIFSVTTPDEAERREIFAIHLRKRRTSIEEVEGDFERVIVASRGHVGAEIEAAVKEAKLRAFNEGTAITVGTLCEQFEQSKPMSQAFAEDFEAMKSWAENNARPASGSSKPAVASAPPRARSRTMPAQTPAPGSLDS